MPFEQPKKDKPRRELDPKNRPDGESLAGKKKVQWTESKK